MQTVTPALMRHHSIVESCAAAVRKKFRKVVVSEQRHAME
jgi:hypothetical protein